MNTKFIHVADETAGTAIITVSSARQAKALISTIAAQFGTRVSNSAIAEFLPSHETARLDTLAVEWVNRISLHARGGMAEWLADHEADGISERVFKVHLMDAYQRGIIGKKDGFYCPKG